ncbi:MULTISPECIES: mechanosensitive ion channel family protein [unclassified Synechococcus]|uniref:mechanosensitive ion channel family protein n=1 Tax=unclassified Synechococcus TaxID=2626047 RepID=UPI000B998507|nr:MULTISPECIES: mechanosensitive ion channel family protein [unclassified Synechococcus]MCP9828937.1 mechanosensitive ion channel family protein [Synechococcus sp. L2F]MCP9845310.1 mechanosensitive ion channel family protein [Synechococcus sp. Lug-A]MCT0209102.1 mechanosensitive ion channel family protein [Synechococcus sp. CS-1333]PZV24907.1 MAG: mechanosensitive ion channel family protein [Cyanobium sp.]
MPESLALITAIVVPFIFKLVGAVALWIAGGWLITLAVRLLRSSLRHSSLDATVVSYLLNILAAVLRVILVVAILGFFGIETASFAALLAGAGVAIGAAWSGMLGNFAAGVFLQVFRPFSVGDFITAAGVTGTVEEIGMFVSSVLSPDNVRNIIPNGKLFSDNIQNYSVHPFRRVELVAQLDNSADVARAVALLKEGIKSVPNQYDGMPADVEVLEFTERGPKLAVRPYTHTDNYWQVYFDTNRMIVDVLGSNGFPVPRIPLAMAAPASN